MLKLNKNLSEIPFYLTKKVSEGVAAEPGAINLSRGQAGFLPPERIYEEAQNMITREDKGLFKYLPSAGDKGLRKSISEWYGRQFDLDVDPNRVAITVGGTGAIDLSFRVFTNPGDQIVIPDPSYPFYTVAAQHGLDDREITRLPIGVGKVTRENLEPYLKDNMQLIMLTSPHNPSGVMYDEETLSELLELAKKRDFWIVYDENHFPEAYDGRKHLPIHAVDKERTHSIMLGSVSRLAIQGERTGWAILPSSQEGLVANYVAASPFACTRSQKLVSFVLDDYEDLGFDKEMKEYEEKRNWLVPKIDSIPGFECNMPEGTSYIFPKIKEFVDENRDELTKTVIKESKKRGISDDEIRLTTQYNSVLAYKFLLYGVGVGSVPGVAYGPNSDDYLRFTFSAPRNELEEAVGRMEKHLK